jgi:hypothetical protein
VNKVDCLIYSKDRALQLDLLLRSIEKHFKNIGKIAILYKYSNDNFKKGYDKVLNNNEYKLNIFSCLETNFKVDLVDLLLSFTTENFLGLCDDDVFIEPCDITETIHHLQHKDINAISLKSGLNITHHYPDIPVAHPTFIEMKPFLKWDWTKQPSHVDWGYPTCINSYIFNIGYYLSLLDKIEVNHPTVLEAKCNTIRNKFRPIMIGTRETKLLNIPCNRLQTVNNTPFGVQHAFTTEELNQYLLDGYVIDTENIYGLKVDRPNLDIAFKFKKETIC